MLRVELEVDGESWTLMTLVPGTNFPLCSHTTNLGLTMVALMTHSN